METARKYKIIFVHVDETPHSVLLDLEVESVDQLTKAILKEVVDAAAKTVYIVEEGKTGLRPLIDLPTGPTLSVQVRATIDEIKGTLYTI
ncbi:uncharacterized protein ACA1_001510 [Acanthamoeba castellanii str. Neff]|jgi:hypothetical protein|uniref:Uncharacterized protein n=1 Tax=Acanthamoeba castellanii (strain ATCC 30010 / Neff) TaxID=1257118 RepID=L8GHD7_ACACF|nr:uncharacterized protein ACA1_001510 [Acanthamoeba castellanii str. Neff]ELR12259.1 hypothetical protein ACA1_001510 [Acanthamoeba castellanii str. Neff]